MNRRRFLALAALGVTYPAWGINAWDYGIVPSGVDQSSAIQALINSTYGRLNFLGGTYVCAGLLGRSNIEIMTEGRGAVFQNQTDTATITFNQKSRFSVGGGITFRGTTAAWPNQPMGGNQHGLVLDGCNEFDFDDLKVAFLNGAGVYVLNSPIWGTVANARKVVAENCIQGIYCAPGAEYVKISQLTATMNHWGYRSDGGNQVLSDSWFIRNSTAVMFKGGTNNGHSVVANCIADHNGTAFTTVNLDAGVELSNFQALGDPTGPPIAGGIWLWNSKLVTWNGGQCGCWFIADGRDPDNGMTVGTRNGPAVIQGVGFRTDYSGMSAPRAQNGGHTPILRGNIVASGSSAAYNN